MTEFLVFCLSGVLSVFIICVTIYKVQTYNPPRHVADNDDYGTPISEIVNQIAAGTQANTQALNAILQYINSLQYAPPEQA